MSISLVSIAKVAIKPAKLAHISNKKDFIEIRKMYTYKYGFHYIITHNHLYIIAARLTC